MRLTTRTFRLRHVAFRATSRLWDLPSRRRRTGRTSRRFRRRSPTFRSRCVRRGSITCFGSWNRFTAFTPFRWLLTRCRRYRFRWFRFRITSQDIRHRSLRRGGRSGSSRSSRCGSAATTSSGTSRRAALLSITTFSSLLLLLPRLFFPRTRRWRRRHRRVPRRLLSRRCWRLVKSRVFAFLVTTRCRWRSVPSR